MRALFRDSRRSKAVICLLMVAFCTVMFPLDHDARILGLSKTFWLLFGVTMLGWGFAAAFPKTRNWKMLLLLLACTAAGLGIRWVLPRPWIPAHRSPFTAGHAAAFLVVGLFVWVVWLQETTRKLKHDLRSRSGRAQ